MFKRWLHRVANYLKLHSFPWCLTGNCLLHSLLASYDIFHSLTRMLLMEYKLFKKGKISRNFIMHAEDGKAFL